MSANGIPRPSSGAVSRVENLYAIADEAERLRDKFRRILDEMAAESARADAMLREIERNA